MSEDKINKLDSQLERLNTQREKYIAAQNRNNAKIRAVKRQKNKELRIQKNATLIAIGEMICEAINKDPLEIDLSLFQDFVNHTWLTYYSNGTPLTSKPGYYYGDYQNVWKKFMNLDTRKNFSARKNQ